MSEGKITSVNFSHDVYEALADIAKENSRSISGQVNHYLRLALIEEGRL